MAGLTFSLVTKNQPENESDRACFYLYGVEVSADLRASSRYEIGSLWTKPSVPTGFAHGPALGCTSKTRI
jgi:hypothetical protein